MSKKPDPFYLVTYYIEWVKTSWTYSTMYSQCSIIKLNSINCHAYVSIFKDIQYYVLTMQHYLVIRGIPLLLRSINCQLPRLLKRFRGRYTELNSSFSRCIRECFFCFSSGSSSFSCGVCGVSMLKELMVVSRARSRPRPAPTTTSQVW